MVRVQVAGLVEPSSHLLNERYYQCTWKFQRLPVIWIHWISIHSKSFISHP